MLQNYIIDFVSGWIVNWCRCCCWLEPLCVGPWWSCNSCSGSISRAAGGRRPTSGTDRRPPSEAGFGTVWSSPPVGVGGPLLGGVGGPPVRALLEACACNGWMERECESGWWCCGGRCCISHQLTLTAAAPSSLLELLFEAPPVHCWQELKAPITRIIMETL